MRMSVAAMIGACLVFSAQIVISGTGGPDDYGYTWIDGDEPDGPEFNWIDITGVGKVVSGLWDDNAVGPFPIGFVFPYYEFSFDSFYVGSNGWISFSSDRNFAHPFAELPDPNLPNDLLACLAGDIDFTLGGTCYYYTTPGLDSLIVSYHNVPEFYNSPPTSHTFQIILDRAKGAITYQYDEQVGNFSNGGSNAFSMGIENSTGTIGLSYFYNPRTVPPPDPPPFADSTVIVFSPPGDSFTYYNDFEGIDPLAGFEVAGWGIRDVSDCQWGPQTAPSGTHAVGVPEDCQSGYPNGNPGQVWEGTLTTPIFRLEDSSLYLSFHYWADFEGITDTYDGVIVEMINLTRGTIVQIDSLAEGHLDPTYDDMIWWGNPRLGGLWAYCYDTLAPLSAFEWREMISQDLIALDYASQGDSIRLTWVFASDQLANGQGYFLDDLCISGANPSPWVDLSITPDGPTTVPVGDTLHFSTHIQNNGDTRVEGDCWLSLLMPDSNEIVIPDGLLNYPNPLHDQIPPYGFLELSNELWVHPRADTGSYQLIGRIGKYPEMIIDEESFEFRVIE